MAKVGHKVHVQVGSSMRTAGTVVLKVWSVDYGIGVSENSELPIPGPVPHFLNLELWRRDPAYFSQAI